MSEASRVKVGEVKLPKGIGKEARAEFRRVRPELIKLGYLEIDQPALLAYLTHYALWRRAKEEVELAPVITTVNGSVQISPWHSIMRQNSELMKKWCQELGFSPGSRRRLGIELEEAADEEELFD